MTDKINSFNVRQLTDEEVRIAANEYRQRQRHKQKPLQSKQEETLSAAPEPEPCNKERAAPIEDKTKRRWPDFT